MMGAPAGRQGKPLRLWIEPNRQRSAPRKCRVVVMRVRGAVGGGLRSAYDVTSRKDVWLFPELVRLEFVPVLHRLLGRFAAEG